MLTLDNCLMHFRVVWGFDIDDELIPRLQKALENGLTESEIRAAIDYVSSRGDDVDNAGEEILLALGRLYKRRQGHIRHKAY